MKMSSKFTCRFCKEQFDQPKGLYKHLQTAHSAGTSTDNRTCPICGVLCTKYEGYRDHLLYIHGQSNEGQKLTFKTLNEFLLWKSSLETKFKCKYVLQSAPKILSLKEKKYFYQCDSSNPGSKDGKKIRSVVMKSCSSVISVIDGPGIIKVEHWDAHSNHVDSSAVSIEKELEAAISSVEMVNAIDESDDSCDQSDDILLSPSDSSPAKKQITIKSAPVNNSTSTPKVQKPIGRQILPKPVSDKKTPSNSSILHSLASVACGKGITKKPPKELNEQSVEGSVDSSPKTSISKISLPLAKLKDSGTPAKTLTNKIISKSLRTVENGKEKILPTLKVPVDSVAPGPLIAPKVTTASKSTASPLASNAVFPNQLVILPAGLDPSSLGSNSNIVSSGQNIVFSLPFGQNILPSNLTIQPASKASGKSTITVSDVKSLKVDTPVINMSSASKTSIQNSILTLPNKNMSFAPSSATSKTPISLSSGMKGAPVILNSLPVGSTFVSVNNNLIPIATPSGALMPTNLPPNIVLTPVGTTSLTKPVNSLLQSSISSSTGQSHVRFSVASKPAVTVSSVVTAPIFSSTPVKGTIATASSKATSLLTPHIGRSPPKGKQTKSFAISHIDKLGSSSPSDTAKAISPILNKIAASGELSITSLGKVGDIPPAKKTTRAKKRVSSTPATALVMMPKVAKTQQNTSSFPFNTVAKKMANNNSETLVFESTGGDVFIMQPIEKGENQVANRSKNTSISRTIKIDRSAQTCESLNLLNDSYQRSKADFDDSAVMLKVKNYQLEMKYMNTMTECKRLKVELTKEKLKNAELTGEKMETNENDPVQDDSRNKAKEIMQEIEDKYSEKQNHIYTMTKTSLLRSLYEDLEDLCNENNGLLKELESYRAHDKFYKSLKRKLDDEDFES